MQIFIFAAEFNPFNCLNLHFEGYLLKQKLKNFMASIQERVTKIIADKLVINESEITPNSNFKKDLGADSIDLVELIMEFEREFGISIPDERAEEIQTVGNAISFLEANS